MANTDTVWTFKTRNFVITLELSECQDDPADSFDDDDETVRAIRNGEYYWFDSAVIVRDRRTGATLGVNTLGASAYSHPAEFWQAHRGPDPMDRNCSIMRAAHGGNVSICHYFPSMVAEAVADARKTLADLKARPLRVA